jgi:hypothetical protein
MRTTAELSRAAQDAYDLVRGQPDVSEVEVFVAANGSLLTRLNYTSHIPCNGVEEPKSVESYGLGIQAVFDTPRGRLLGFGSEPSDLSVAGAARALAKARQAAVADPEFVSLPPRPREMRALTDYHDPELMAVSDDRLVEAGWTIVNGALRTFVNSSRLAELAGSDEGLRRLGLIVGGDVTMLQERIAVVSSHMPAVQTDESTLISAFVTAMVEAQGAKGSGSSATTRLGHFTDEAGVMAAQAAIDAMGGERVPAGRYTVVFGRQPVADIMNNLIVPACNAEAFYASATPFLGRLGSTVASPRLSIYDHGAMPGLVGSKGITCEGLPTGRTDLIRHGKLAGCPGQLAQRAAAAADPGAARQARRPARPPWRRWSPATASASAPAEAGSSMARRAWPPPTSWSRAPSPSPTTSCCARWASGSTSGGSGTPTRSTDRARVISPVRWWPTPISFAAVASWRP